MGMRVLTSLVIAAVAASLPGGAYSQHVSPEQLGANKNPIGEPGVAWYTTWETGYDEAARSGRPIFLMFAATQCKGVPGIF